MFIFPSPFAAATCSCTPAYATGDRTGSITVTQSNWTNGGETSGLVDGNTSSPNAITKTTASRWIKFDFGAGNKILITEMRAYFQVSHISEETGTIEGSDDDSSWTTIATGGTWPTGSTTRVWDGDMSGNTTGYRYYRLTQTSAGSSGQWVHEFEFKQCTC